MLTTEPMNPAYTAEGIQHLAMGEKLMLSSFRTGWGIELVTILAVLIALVAVGPYLTFDTANFNNATARYLNETLSRKLRYMFI